MSEMEEALAHMTEGPGARFGHVTEQDDFIHGEGGSQDYSVTETYWFSFDLPEEGLHGQIYIWMHPNLKVASAGCWIWNGAKRHYLEAEHFNCRHYLPFPTVEGSAIRIAELGLTLRIIDPLRVIEVEYIDDASGTRVAFRAEGLIAPVARSSNKHFDQPMHLIGDMVLNGRQMPIDCMSMRDRSWGEPRPEIPNLDHPPVCWGVGVSKDGSVSFNFSGVDDPAREGGNWTDAFKLEPEKHFKEGWISWKGELRKLVSMSKATVRDPENLDRIISLVADVVDDQGEHYSIKGTMLGCVQWSAWSNILVHWNAMRWEIGDDIVGYGDALEMSWAPHVKHIRRQAAGK